MKTIGNIAEQLISASSQNHPFSDVFLKWDEIVGENVATLAEPHKIMEMSAGKILIVKAKQGCAIELQHESTNMIDAINSYFKKKSFIAIRVIQN